MRGAMVGLAAAIAAGAWLWLDGFAKAEIIAGPVFGACAGFWSAVVFAA
jgi:hypothetical protein